MELFAKIRAVSGYGRAEILALLRRPSGGCATCAVFTFKEHRMLPPFTGGHSQAREADCEPAS